MLIFLEKPSRINILVKNLFPIFNNDICGNRDANCEYSRLHYFMWYDFDLFFTNRLTVEAAKLKLKEAREIFIRENSKT